MSATHCTLQHTATHCNRDTPMWTPLIMSATHCNTLQHTATETHQYGHHSLCVQHTAIHCNILQQRHTNMDTTHYDIAVPATLLLLYFDARDILQHTATHCNTHCNIPKHTATSCTHFNTLQHTATHCNMWRVKRLTARHYNTQHCRAMIQANLLLHSKSTVYIGDNIVCCCSNTCRIIRFRLYVCARVCVCAVWQHAHREGNSILKRRTLLTAK